MVEYRPPAGPDQAPTFKYGYAAMAAGAAGLDARVKLVNGNKITLIVPW